MPAGPVGASWDAGSWEPDAWDEGAWRDVDADSDPERLDVVDGSSVTRLPIVAGSME